MPRAHAAAGDNDQAEASGTPIRMFRSEKNYDWLTEKYGADVRPWEFKVTLDNKDWKNTMATGQNKIFYTYSLRNDFSLGQINQ